MDYKKIYQEEETMTYTSTWRPPTKEECEEQIVELATKYAHKKWWDSGRYYLKQMKWWVENLKLAKRK